GNFIGTNAAGTIARGNTVGIRVESSGNLIGGSTPGARNLISGNGAYGLEITGAAAIDNSVKGNYIGTNKAGAAQLRNVSHGVIVIDGADNTIGGTTAGDRNVVSGNGDDGIKLLGPVGGNVVQGNYIGTDAAGTADVGNEAYGITLDKSINPLIGGTVAGARNVISGNTYAGVEFIHTEGGRVQGNLIGTRADGTGDLGNGRIGVFILASDVVIGGSGSAGNVISGNGDHGVWIQYSSYTGNQVLGNVIKLNEFNGVHSMSDETLVQGNLIFSNGFDGVHVHSNSQGTRITANQIYGNGELGIDIQGGTENAAGVTSNDTDDPDTGANNRQNFPVLTGATRSNATGLTTVTGTLNSNPGTEFRIELFMAVADASGSGEGQVPLAALTITTNSGGDKGFAFASGAWPVGMVLTATATSTTAGNTSEFSVNRTVMPGP
ncbi:MAG TPA: right-handed parallel beta-helix repeat-containing protein, partial [Candidatus Limnocylindrales bacterium]|nr:right-handed parallel beta-helix repeat-containing protein [Candidatus Limnocylindrales bacterium]